MNQTAPDPRRWLALIVASMAVFMDFLDVTIVGVALSAIRAELGASDTELQWILAAYALAFAALLITGGRLGDLYGRRRVFVAGVCGFTLASLLCAVAGTGLLLILGRAFQGAMAAAMVPQVLSMAQVLFKPQERALAIGVYGSVISLATVSGPLLGGFLVDFSWRLIFWINLPIGVLTCAGALILLRESKSERPPRLDLAGVAIVSTGLVALMYPLVQGGSLGGSVLAGVLLGVGGAALLAGFFLHQQRVAAAGGAPLVPPDLFALRTFRLGLGVNTLLYCGVSAFFMTFMIHLQQGLNMSALESGLIALPWPVGILLSRPMMRYERRFGPALLRAGPLLLSAGMALQYAALAFGTPVWWLLPGLLIGGFGMGLMGPMLLHTALDGVPRSVAGAASGLLNTVAQIGTALGVALLGGLFFTLLSGGPAAGTAEAMAAAYWYEIALYLVTALLVWRIPRPTVMSAPQRAGVTSSSAS
ncbi:MFS transporter [Sinosporangium siamense]|uniref:MFS transporter n=1 Tax=Sinosporangium siamense TaxID=1367973 RepID=A0A919VEF0_9ACTN|nr:MFS transporter [Sinosporangium siamense]GII95059.1 MFS transporter [Sinosporangium siamense]